MRTSIRSIDLLRSGDIGRPADQRFVSDHRFPPRKWLNATLPLDGALKNHGGHDVRKKALIEQLIFTGFEIVNESENWPNHDHYCVTAHVGWD